MEENGFERQPDIDPVDLANAPKVSLGGKIFGIPRLAIAQNKVVVGCFKQLMPMIGQIETMALREKANPGTASSSILQNFPVDETSFDLMTRAVYAALTRGYAISQDAFGRMPIGIDELIMAIPVVLAQSFAFTKKGGTPAAPGGEAPAAALTISETKPLGTESPSESAEPLVGPGTTSNAA